MPDGFAEGTPFKKNKTKQPFVGSRNVCYIIASAQK